MNHPLKTSLVAIVASLVPALAAAQSVQKEPEGVVSLSASATVPVPNDWMTVQFSASKEGADAAAVQAALKEALATALAQARQVARPDGQVEVQAGGFSLQPRFDGKGRITAWVGSTALVVQGRDMGAIADLAGRVSSMTVGSLDYSVSRAAREKVEGEVTAQAIARFRAKAADYAKAFGYGGYAIREVNVQAETGQPPRPYMAKAAVLARVSQPLPTEAGSGSVTSSVSGSVQLK